MVVFFPGSVVLFTASSIAHLFFAIYVLFAQVISFADRTCFTVSLAGGFVAAHPLSPSFLLSPCVDTLDKTAESFAVRAIVRVLPLDGGVSITL